MLLCNSPKMKYTLTNVEMYYLYPSDHSNSVYNVIVTLEQIYCLLH